MPVEPLPILQLDDFVTSLTNTSDRSWFATKRKAEIYVRQVYLKAHPRGLPLRYGRTSEQRYEELKRKFYRPLLWLSTKAATTLWKRSHRRAAIPQVEVCWHPEDGCWHLTIHWAGKEVVLHHQVVETRGFVWASQAEWEAWANTLFRRLAGQMARYLRIPLDVPESELKSSTPSNGSPQASLLGEDLSGEGQPSADCQTV